MPILESQLTTWSHQGAVTTAKLTNASVRYALERDTSPLKTKLSSNSVEVYLQGSYKNDTNIRSDSDVDVVVQLNSVWGRDLSALPQEQVDHYLRTHSTATYQWEHFRADVLKALRAHYGAAAVKQGNKAIKIVGASGRLPADVVPAVQFRNYVYFFGPGPSAQLYHEGVRFHSAFDGRQIVNYPKLHYDNGVLKHSPQRTNGWYKPVVRIFKNMRTCLVDQGRLTRDVAPSYYLECLLYNVPDGLFGTTYEASVLAILTYLQRTDPTAYVCQNEQLLLFGNQPEQWNTNHANQAFGAIVDLWNNG